MSQPTLTPAAFAQKWRGVTATEKAASQSHFIDLCRMVGEPAPLEADPTGEQYAFEKRVEKAGGGDGFADVWKRGFFAWEYKGPRKDLKAAYVQLLNYKDDLGNPPLLVVSDLDRIEIRTNFTGLSPALTTITLDDLAANDPSEALQTRAATGTEPEEPEEPSDVAFGLEQAQERAWEDIRSHLASMPPYDFQQLVGALLRAMDYHVAWIAPPGADGGIDILAYRDPLGATGPRIKVQVKRHESKVSPETLRSFIGVLGEDDIGIFVATGGVTSGTEAEARRESKRKLTLIDLEKLYQLWVQYQDRVEEAHRQLLPLTPVYYLDKRL